MTEDLVCCDDFQRLIASPSVPLNYNPKIRTWDLSLLNVSPDVAFEWRNASSVSQRIDYCPSCGIELPSSLRERYFEEMDKLGIDFADIFSGDAEIPEPYQTDQWWREAGL